MTTSKTIFDVGDRITWTDDDVDPPAQRTGNIAAMLSTQMLVTCTDGKERFVTERNRTVKLVAEDAR